MPDTAYGSAQTCRHDKTRQASHQALCADCRMLILFVLLALQILPAKWVNPGCYVLIRYMALLFVPIGVGVMQYFDLLRAQFGPVVVSCAISTLVVFLVVSWSSQLVHGERKVVGQKGSEE